MSSIKIRHIYPTVHPFVRMEQLGSHSTDFREIWYFEKLLKEIKLHWNLTRITGTLREDQYTILILCRSIILKMKNILGKLCGEFRNTHFVFNNFFFRKWYRLWDNVEKYCTVVKAADDNIAHAHCMLHTRGYKYTNTYCFSTATMVARTRLNVTLFAHCLSCFITNKTLPVTHT
jgi:hypothetical protein